MEDKIPQWPQGISLEKDGIYDQYIKKSFAINATGHQFAQHVDGKSSVTSIANKIAEQYQMNPDEIAEDAKQFFYNLNNRLLVNFDQSSFKGPDLYFLKLIMSLLFSGQFGLLKNNLFGFNNLWKRHVIRINGWGSLIAGLLKMYWLILTELKVLWIVPAIGMLFFAILSGLMVQAQTRNINLSLFYLFSIFFITFGIVFSIALHETGHGLASCFLLKNREIILGVNSTNARVVCPRGTPKQEGWIAFCGPLLNILFFLILGGCTLLFRGNWGVQWILCGLAICVGAGSFSLFGGDGRKIKLLFIRPTSLRQHQGNQETIR
jgi:hypothetical protein